MIFAGTKGTPTLASLKTMKMTWKYAKNTSTCRNKFKNFAERALSTRSPLAPIPARSMLVFLAWPNGYRVRLVMVTSTRKLFLR